MLRAILEGRRNPCPNPTKRGASRGFYTPNKLLTVSLLHTGIVPKVQWNLEEGQRECTSLATHLPPWWGTGSVPKALWKPCGTLNHVNSLNPKLPKLSNPLHTEEAFLYCNETQKKPQGSKQQQTNYFTESTPLHWLLDSHGTSQ